MISNIPELANGDIQLTSLSNNLSRLVKKRWNRIMSRFSRFTDGLDKEKRIFETNFEFF